MDKRELLRHFAGDEELRLTLAQVLDHMETARRRLIPSRTAYLSPRERIAAEDLLRSVGCTAYLPLGGWREAERQTLLFLPDWMEPEQVEQEEYLSLLRCTWYEGERLTHRDFLGALMGMGVRRDTVGDILVDTARCDLIVLPTVADFLHNSMTSAGRTHLTITRPALTELLPPKQERKLIRTTVSTLRLDSVLGAGFSLSRSRAAQLIESGHCAVNWRETARTSQILNQGDVISCRGLGKCRLKEVGGMTRKDRITVTVERYL